MTNVPVRPETVVKDATPPPADGLVVIKWDKNNKKTEPTARQREKARERATKQRAQTDALREALRQMASANCCDRSRGVKQALALLHLEMPGDCCYRAGAGSLVTEILKRKGAA